jgi:signal peptidase II
MSTPTPDAPHHLGEGNTAVLAQLNSGIGVGQWRWLWLSAGVIVLDQWTKWLITRAFVLGESLTMLPVFNLVRAHNRGAAFSFLDNDSAWPRWAFAILATGVSIALIVWLKRLPRRTQLLAAALAFILGGAIGNLIDRVRLGYVVDFIQVHWAEHYFPAFNVADSAVTVGAALLLLDTWLAGRRR